ncbi:MAG: hypothetical protein ABI718_05860 [Acidobacteriota bacterium]
MSRRLLVLSVVSLVLCSSVFAASKAKLVKDKKTISLSNVTATRFAPAEGPAQVILLFSDVKPQGLAVFGPFGEEMMAISKWVQDSSAHAVKVGYTEGEEANYSLNVYGGEDTFSSGGSRSGDDMIGVFRKINGTESKISGELKWDGPPGVLSGTFDVVPDTVHEAPVVKGAAVAKSEEAATLLGFARGMSKFNLKAAQPYSARDLQDEFGKAKEQMGEKVVKEMIKEMIGDPKKLETLLKSDGASLQEAGDKAVIRLKETIKDANGEGSTTQTFSFSRVAGKWKIE